TPAPTATAMGTTGATTGTTAAVSAGTAGTIGGKPPPAVGAPRAPAADAVRAVSPAVAGPFVRPGRGEDPAGVVGPVAAAGADPAAAARANGPRAGASSRGGPVGSGVAGLLCGTSPAPTPDLAWSRRRRWSKVDGSTRTASSIGRATDS